MGLGQMSLLGGVVREDRISTATMRKTEERNSEAVRVVGVDIDEDEKKMDVDV